MFINLDSRLGEKNGFHMCSSHGPVYVVDIFFPLVPSCEYFPEFMMGVRQ